MTIYSFFVRLSTDLLTIHTGYIKCSICIPDNLCDIIIPREHVHAEFQIHVCDYWSRTTHKKRTKVFSL